MIRIPEAQEMEQVVAIHRKGLPHTLSSRMGKLFLRCLYELVRKVGYVLIEERGGKIVGVTSGVGKLILTLVVDPLFQRQGVGRELINHLPGERWVYTESGSVEFYRKMGFSDKRQMGNISILRRLK